MTKPIPPFFPASSARRIVQALAGVKTARLALPGTSAVGALWASVWQQTGHPVIIILNRRDEAGFVFRDLQQWMPAGDLFFLPASFRHLARPGDTDAFSLQSRMQTLDAWQKGIPALTVSYAEAFLEKIPAPEAAAGRQFTLHTGDISDPDFLNEWLFSMDFERVDLVSEPGEFALRGGIIDLFPFNTAEPYRIEFDDDRIARIAPFDPETQLRSHRTVDSLQISGPPAGDEQLTEISRVLPGNAILWFASHRQVEMLAREISEAHRERLWRDFRIDALPPGINILSGSEIAGPDLSPALKPLPPFGAGFELFEQYVNHKISEGYSLYLACGNDANKKRLEKILESRLPDVAFHWLNYELWAGWDDAGQAVAVIPEHSIFGRPAVRPADKRRKKKQKLLLRELNQWNKGDYIVHADHGIGIYEGLVKMQRSGQTVEAVKLRYKNDDLIYVGIHSLHKLSKYRNRDGKPPKIHGLGSTAWQRTKQRTKKRLKKLAFDLLQLYAERKQQRGFAFGADTPMQWQLESSFRYEDTPDQARATAEVKRDMEAPRPMDRLVCGDVGFGKTEIAIRAAFKAADNGKQTAVLVPTTVLAFQHYRTFSQRLKNFPVTVEYLNRFRSAKQRKQILDDLAAGKIDILIGTHAIVSDKVRFKDLGLLIIDEEQKFGVNIKEKIKNLKKHIDVLTLTATPIPRTLQFSLMGERDLSVINTPPPNRIPIRTEVHRFDRQLIRRAVEREMARGGQVFFVHNRVKDIEQIAAMLRHDVPHARIAVAHGQMKGSELEKIMLDFMRGRYDVLVSTAIVENGLDVPNANTMIVNNAHMFGLADLHQLRGRVGRSDREAYCWFLIPSQEALNEDARKRMHVLETYTALGSGFEIAMRDLEIRGAGDLLGAEQSGFINDLGFDLYRKILAEAVDETRRELSDEQEPENFVLHPEQVTVHTDSESFIPTAYVPSSGERLTLYRQINGAKDFEALEQIRREMTDRFGPLPPQASELLQWVRIKILAARLGFEKIIWKKGVLSAYPTPDPAYVDSDIWPKILEYAGTQPGRFSIRPRSDGGFVLEAGGIFSPPAIEKLFDRLVENIISENS